jgi:DNA polymerase
MIFTREDLLRELELLPVWRANSALEVSLKAPLEAKQEKAHSTKVHSTAESTPKELMFAVETVLAPQESVLPDVANMDWVALAQFVQGSGDINADWVFVGDASSVDDEEIGQLFMGDAGALLDKMLLAIQLQRSKDVYLTHLALPYFNRQMALIQPKLIVVLGEQVSQRLLGSNEPLDALRGKVHEFQGTAVVVSYAPSHLLQHTQDKAKAWADLCLARSTMENLK